MSSRRATFECTGVAQCPYSISLEYVSRYMSRFASGTKETMIVLPFRGFGLPFIGGLRRRVHLVFDIVEDHNNRSRAHEALKFHWNARTRYLPNLEGMLRFRIVGIDRTELALECQYEPPFGSIGGVFDRLIGRRLAIATGGALLERIIGEMDALEQAFELSYSVAATS